MALYSDYFSVYVAFHLVIIALPDFSTGSSNVLSLLQPYDFLYYSGVRSYFGGEWVKAAELLEKSIVTKESLFRVRRKCHDACVAAGREAADKLGKLKPIKYRVIRGKKHLLFLTGATTSLRDPKRSGMALLSHHFW